MQTLLLRNSRIILYNLKIVTAGFMKLYENIHVVVYVKKIK